MVSFLKAAILVFVFQSGPMLMKHENNPWEEAPSKHTIQVLDKSSFEITKRSVIINKWNKTCHPRSIKCTA